VLNRVTGVGFHNVSKLDFVRLKDDPNDFDNFALSVKDQITGLMIDRMDKNEQIVSKFLDEEEFKELVTQHIARKIYEGLKAG
jgi:hypothetical protein